MAVLTVAQLKRGGVLPAGAVASAAGDSVLNDGRTILLFISTDTTSHTVTIPILTKVDGQSVVQGKQLTFPGGDGFTAFPALTDVFPTDYNDALGRINWTYSIVSPVMSIWALRVSRPS